MPRQLKILILGDINSIHLQKWILGLLDDFELTVFSLDPIDTTKNQGKYLSERIVVVTNRDRTTGNKPKLSYLSALRPLKKLARQFDPDIVHAHYASSYGLLARLLRPKRLFISVWGSDVFEFPRRSALHARVFRWILKGADRLFSTSKAMAAEIRKYTDKETHVIPFGIDTRLFKWNQERQGGDQKIIGTVKALEVVYGIDRLIQVTALLMHEFPDLKCIIYGEGSERQNLEQLSIDLGVKDRVHFMGFLNNTELPEVIVQMDVFCVLSRQESFGVSALEAQACGVPVVATNVGGLPEVVAHETTGFIVEEDPSQAAEKVAVLLKDKTLNQQFGINARNFVVENYDWNTNINALKAFYHS